MESLPGYVPIVFILTTFAAVAFLLYAAQTVGFGSLPSKILLVVIPVWLILTDALASNGFYQNSSSLPPRLVLFGVLPAQLLILAYFIFFRPSFIDRLPLRTMTLLHIVRIPVEIVLLWLSFGSQVPQVMTFEGRNFDIFSGILAPIVYLIAFRTGATKRWVLIGYNVLGLLLLANIVSIAIMSLPSPIQQIAFDQPNRAVLVSPYIWLPTVVVPIVFFAHVASLWKLLRNDIS